MELKFSIITVVKNDEKHISRTIKSIIKQNYNNIQYIVIDGNSKDSTLKIINSYKPSGTLWEMAGVTRLELAASCVTGKRSNQLSYTPKRKFFGKKNKAIKQNFLLFFLEFS